MLSYKDVYGYDQMMDAKQVMVQDDCVFFFL